ncbi:hypothetical protein [Accumulibacter sp.]|uniref:hypothetical protein n=1 Tax=Accumulibacter sp. TaxID=2053492 RepID=UPI00260BBB61|nr:hypothetical protein [Accumulibacter sp.]
MSARRLTLFTFLVLAAWLALFGDKTPTDRNTGEEVAALPARTAGGWSGEVSNPRRAGRPPPGSRALADLASANLEVAALIPRQQLIPAAADGQESRDLFPPLSWTPPPPLPEKSANPPPPMAPPVPFVYLGKKLEGGQWEAYLGFGEQVFIVRAGMTLAGTYQVKAVSPPTLTLIYLPLKQSQTIPIGESP